MTTAGLTGGGLIKFRCGADPVTIQLTVQSVLETGWLVILNVPNNTTIDGEDMVTLTGAFREIVDSYSASVIYVDPTATVVLKNLSLRSTTSTTVGHSGTLAR